MTGSSRGQALTEFTIMIPILMVLLLAVADFGRVFQAAIVMQSATRAAAEAAALEYLRTEEIRTSPPAGWSQADYFDKIHEVASVAACQEARVLGNTTYQEGPPVTCPTWPAVVVCVHDADMTDTACGTPSGGYTAGPAECSVMGNAWSTTEDVQTNDYVEVRLCYQFTTMFNLQLDMPMGAGMSLGDLYLQNSGAFVVADY